MGTSVAAAYTDVFRGLPMLLVLFIVGYGIPGLQLQGAPQSTFVLGIIALVLTYSAYVSEVLRAGINSVHRGQRDAVRPVHAGGRIRAGHNAPLPASARTIRGAVPKYVSATPQSTKPTAR